MNRIPRPPTRVSKACDRCRRQKQRCDFERPCQHCEHAQTACVTTTVPTTKLKPRLRRNADSSAATTTMAWQATLSHSQGPDRHSLSTHRSSEATRHDFEEASQDEMMWETRKVSNTSNNQTSPSGQHQPNRENPTLPGFVADSALAITRKIFRSQPSPTFRDRATFAIPGGGCRDTNGTNSLNHVPSPLMPVVQIIGIELPTYEVCNKLLETYFSAVHWFSLVIYEPKFRDRFNAIVGSGLASRRDHGFLLLLLIVLTMGCWYTPKQNTEDLGLSGNDMEALRSRLIKVVQRDFMELMDEDSLEFVQVCALLGSFYLYHGRPRSSFSILGAATKTSQAMDLHRDSEMRWSFEDREERRRVWWTIYTWDRFATITYGRPLCINDKDCNVPGPSEILENVHFDPLLEATQICLSTYQRQLNQVYRIASPLLEDIYGMRTSHHMGIGSQLAEMVSITNQSLLEWQQNLPPYLSFDQINDLTAYSSTEEKMHSLQALSLQLTYDNLMIVINRPLLAGRRYIDRSTAAAAMSPNSQYSDDMRDNSFKRCLNSALRISNIQRKQNLFSLARTTHLVSFLGMNLFTASVVLFICALSDTLSDTAQEAKRGLKRTLQMQKALSNHASLSMQCSMILEDLVQLILKKEMEEMLHDHSTNNENTFNDPAIPEEYLQGGVLRGEMMPNQSGSRSGIHSATFDTSIQETTHHEGSHFKQSLMTLNRVFQDSSHLQHQVDANGDLGTRHDYGDFTPVEDSLNPGGVISTQDFGLNDNIFTRVEDIGQFWLWNSADFNP